MLVCYKPLGRNFFSRPREISNRGPGQPAGASSHCYAGGGPSLRPRKGQNALSHRLLPAKPPALGRASLRGEEGARAIMRSTCCAFVGVTTAQLLVPPKKMVFRTRDPLTNTTSNNWRKALAIDGFPTFMGVAEAHEKADDDVLAAMR